MRSIALAAALFASAVVALPTTRDHPPSAASEGFGHIGGGRPFQQAGIDLRLHRFQIGQIQIRLDRPGHFADCYGRRLGSVASAGRGRSFPVEPAFVLWILASNARASRQTPAAATGIRLNMGKPPSASGYSETTPPMRPAVIGETRTTCDAPGGYLAPFGPRDAGGPRTSWPRPRRTNCARSRTKRFRRVSDERCRQILRRKQATQ